MDAESKGSAAVRPQAMSQSHDDREDHGCCAHDGGTNQHRLGCRLERVSSTIVLFQMIFGLFEIYVEAILLFEFVFDARNLLDGGEFVYGLRVVGDWAVGINSDGDRTHTEEAERH